MIPFFLTASQKSGINVHCERYSAEFVLKVYKFLRDENVIIG